MKKSILFTLAAAALVLSAASCSKTEVADSGFNSNSLELVANLAGDSKVIMQKGGKMFWTTKDQIKVFYGSTLVGTFANTNTKIASTGKFICQEPFDYDTTESDYYYAAYPASDLTKVADGKMTLIFPKDQIGYPDSLRAADLPLVAKSTDLNPTFYNVCGGIKFSVVKEGIKKVELVTGATTIGTYDVDMTNPSAPVVVAKSTIPNDYQVALYCNENLVVGKYYYIASIPEVLPEGSKLIFYTDTEKAVKDIPANTEIKRGVFGIVDNIDAGLVWESTADEINAELIFYNTNAYASRNPQATSDYTFVYGVSCIDGNITDFTYYILPKAEYDKDPDYYNENFVSFGDDFDADDIKTLNTKGTQAYVGWTFASGTEYIMLGYIKNDKGTEKILSGVAATTKPLEEPVEKRTYTLEDLSPVSSKEEYFGTYDFYFTSNDYDARVSYDKPITISDGGFEEQDGERVEYVVVEGVLNTLFNNRVSFTYPESYWVYDSGYLYTTCEEHGAFLLDGALYRNWANVVDVVAFENVRGMADYAFVLGKTKEGNIAMVDSGIYKNEDPGVSGVETYGAALYTYIWLFDDADNSIGYYDYLGNFLLLPQAESSSVNAASVESKTRHNSGWHLEKLAAACVKQAPAKVGRAHTNKLCTVKLSEIDR